MSEQQADECTERTADDETERPTRELAPPDVLRHVRVRTAVI
jgi:hypothetical protein